MGDQPVGSNTKVGQFFQSHGMEEVCHPLITLGAGHPALAGNEGAGSKEADKPAGRPLPNLDQLRPEKDFPLEPPAHPHSLGLPAS